jgi:flagellar hook protein FlgE
MSLLGALDTAITGLNAQSSAFTNIGDDVANSQTIGFKGTDTRFQDYLTSSTATQNLSGSVVATPEYQNTLQGTVTQSSVPLAMAITGQGFFPVSQSTGTNNGQPVFAAQQQYTRAGDFQLDKQGYIVNGSGQYLNAWPVDAAGNVNKTQLSPVQVSQTSANPQATSQITLAANLPATPSTTASLTTQVPVYDALGTEHQLTLAWSQTTTPGSWQVQISSADSTPQTIGTATVSFGTGGAGATPGLINSITDPAGTTIPYAVGQPAAFNISANFGSGAQPISLNLGTFGQSDGLTRFAGTDLSVKSVNQNGAAAGSFTGVSTTANGAVVMNFSNGQNTVIAQVPIVTFANPNALQRQNDQTFTATTASGAASAQDPSSNGAGNLVIGSVESSNVDIAQEFSKLIIAQRAYSANTKLVTTADQMLQQTIDMKQ